MIGFISDKTDFFRIFHQNITYGLYIWYINKHTMFLCVVTVVYAISVAWWFLKSFTLEKDFSFVYCFN